MEMYDKLNLFEQYHKVSIKQCACRSFLKQVKEAFLYSWNIMISETFSYGQRLSGMDYFDCSIQNAKSDITQDFKNKVDH